MRRFFIEDITPGSRFVSIRGEEFSHLRRVLRLKKGDEVSVFNGRGLELKGTIDSMAGECAGIGITGEVEAKTESPFDITLLQAMLKGDKNELVIAKATELGVRRISFYATQRTVRLIKEDSKTLKRWQRVSIEALKQCNRVAVPEIDLIKDFKGALERYSNLPLKVFLYEGEETVGLNSALGKIKTGDMKDIAVVIGPEGGFTEEEVREASLLGYIVAGLGPRRLKSETAAISVISILQHRFGDMG
ncbi:MAG: RsmE family RNA methyltransferase [Deltaproteobacteria bacterium]